MQNYKNLKHFILLFGLLLPIAWCGATTLILKDGYSAIQVKVAQVQSVPKGSSIQASINGHLLTVVFLENLGQVTVEGPLHYAPTSQFPTTPYYSCYIDWHEYPSNDSDLYLKIIAVR